jgi:hypothetical protein
MWMFCITLKGRNTKRFVQNWHSPRTLNKLQKENIIVILSCFRYSFIFLHRQNRLNDGHKQLKMLIMRLKSSNYKAIKSSLYM